MPTRSAAVAALILVVAGAASCAGDDAATTTTLTAAPTSTAPAPTPTPTTSASSTTTPASTTAPTSTVAVSEIAIDVTVTDEGVDGEERYEAPLGAEVTITVTSTFADEVHVHGYNLFTTLEPDVPGRITFVADVPGIFEVELEDAVVPLFELVVE
jgi:hypothetical protein